MIDPREHWDSVYRSKPDVELSWTQEDPGASISLISEVCPPPDSGVLGGRVLDVGGGTSPLVARLLDAGYRIAVLDISTEALERAKEGLGDLAGRVSWIVADVTVVDSVGAFDVWHDRAVFHFLTNESDRRRYAALAARSIPVGGHAIIATFALDGPTKCSGLEVCRYDGPALAREMGPAWELLRTVQQVHLTPWGKPQSFQYSVFQRVLAGAKPIRFDVR